MNEDYSEPLQGEFLKLTEQLKDTHQYVKELRIQLCLSALVIAGLVAVVFETFSFLLFAATNTDLDITLYKFSLLIGPSALFLLFLHFYELFGIIKKGEKSIPFTLDLMYFLYISIAFPSLIGIQWYYQRHLIPSTFLTTGWFLFASMLCIEVLIALFLAKYLIMRGISQKLPHFFIHQPADQHRMSHPRPVRRQRPTPKQAYYFRKKPDVALWEHEDCFIRFNQ
jgi:hypothetical protein